MKNSVKKNLVKSLKEGLGSLSNSVQNTNSSIEAAKAKAKVTVVTFDKSTSPFEVKFSERGFEINDTRLSFEFIETALAKEINIVLEKGKGIVLDSIKMEKILKYKDYYARQNVG